MDPNINYWWSESSSKGSVFDTIFIYISLLPLYIFEGELSFKEQTIERVSVYSLSSGVETIDSDKVSLECNRGYSKVDRCATTRYNDVGP